MRYRRGWRSLCVAGCLFVGACCTIPVGGTTDWPGVAPFLAGNWQAISEGEVILQIAIDSTGDPVAATITPTLLDGSIPVGVPNPILLDGQPRNVSTPGLPFTASYVGRARANKANPNGPIAVGETISIVVELELYMNLPVPLQPPLLVGTGMITYSGKFTQTFEADGSVRAIISLSSEAQQIAQSFGTDLPVSNLDTTISGVQLIRR